MLVPLILLALLAVLLVALASRPANRNALRRVYARFQQPSAATGATQTVSREAPTLRATSPRVVVLAVLALLLVFSIVALPRSLFAPRDQFLVLVAPFSTPNGTANEAGRTAARDLAQELNRTGSTAVVLDQVPSSIAQIDERMRQEGADALIYGTIEDGALLDQPSLTPMLIYQPSGAYAPAGWANYNGRFAMPRAYALSAQPINGKIVLPLLMRALGRYGAGDYDGAFADFDTLLNDYPELAPSLPRALRGNILWAAGNYAAAAAEYERTGVMATSDSQASESALLANNLGAIYQDQGGVNAPQAAQAFAQAARLLGTEELGQLRLNLARAQVEDGRYDEAIAALEPGQAAASALHKLTLADAYLGAGQFDKAEGLLADLPQQAREEARNAIEPYVDLETRRLLAAIDQRKIRLALDRAVGNNDQIVWELFNQDVDHDALNAPRDQLEALANRNADLARDWQRVAAAADVSQHAYRAQVANQQSRLAEATRYDERKLLAAIDLELGRERGVGERTVDSVFSLLRGQRGADSRLNGELRDLTEAQPNDAEAGVLLGFGQIANNQPADARATFERVNGFAPRRPEPVFGLAQTYLRQEPERAKALLREAINRDNRFFPARTQLAQIAQNEGDWATAIEQRRWLADQRTTVDDKLTLADTLQKSGPSGYTEAEQVLLPLANTKNVRATIQLSGLYLAAGNQPAAQTALERARDEAPRDPQVAYQLGVVLEQVGRRDDAREQLKQAIALDGNNAQARVALGRIYSADGDIGNAARQYDAALRSGTDDPAALQDIGAVLLVAGEYNRALDAYRQAADKAPNDPNPLLGIARVRLAQNNPQEAAVAAQKAVTLPNGNTAAANVVLGNVSLGLGDVPGAVGHFTVASNLDPRYVPAQLGLGRTAAINGNWDVARSYFEQAIGIDENVAEAHVWRGEALLRANDLPAASAEYSQALRLQTNYPEAHYGQAKVQAASGSLAEAHASIAQALAERRNYADAYVLDGLIYEQENRRDDARRAYDRAVDADRNGAEAYYRRALITVADGDVSAAGGDLEAAVRNRDNFPEAHYWLGRSYLADGKPDKANQQFALALSQSPNNTYPEALYYQGVAREQLGDLPSALVAYQGALQQAQGSAWAAEAQAALTRLGQ